MLILRVFTAIFVIEEVLKKHPAYADPWANRPTNGPDEILTPSGTPRSASSTSIPMCQPTSTCESAGSKKPTMIAEGRSPRDTDDRQTQGLHRPPRLPPAPRDGPRRVVGHDAPPPLR